MRFAKFFSRTPLAWANLAFILILYGVLGAVVLSTQGRITSRDVLLIWPLHVIFAINVLAVLGPTRRR